MSNRHRVNCIDFEDDSDDGEPNHFLELLLRANAHRIQNSALSDNGRQVNPCNTHGSASAFNSHSSRNNASSSRSNQSSTSWVPGKNNNEFSTIMAHKYLKICIENQKADNIMRLIERYPSLDMDFYPESPYMQLVENTFPANNQKVKKKIIEKMLKMGADINAVSLESGETLLMTAFKVQNKQVLSMLLSDPWKTKLNVITAHSETNETSLFYAIRYRMQSEEGRRATMPLSFVKTLIELGSDPEHWDEEKCQPLDLAIEVDDVECVSLLLEAGVPIRTNCWPLPPLCICSMSGIPNIARKLLIAGGPPDGNEYFGESPLYTALTVPNKDMVELLVESGCNLSHEPYLIDYPDQRRTDLSAPSLLKEDPKLMARLRGLANEPVSLKVQARKFLWKMRIPKSKSNKLGLPKGLVNFLYTV